MSRNEKKLGVRWTIGDVSREGFEALRLSVSGAFRVFGSDAAYAICLNTVPIETGKSLVGDLPVEVRWIAARSEWIPPFLREQLGPGMAEGVAWKFAPMRLFPDLPEIALDNDCILWGMPAEVDRWLGADDPGQCLLAEDVKRMFGRFSDLCGPEPRNSGIRGIPAGFDLDSAFRKVLARNACELVSESDEQGLQVAALSLEKPPRAVSVEDVSICSPFPPHMADLGRSGAHFVGLNARELPWSSSGRPASEYIREHWAKLKGRIYRKLGIDPPEGV